MRTIDDMVRQEVLCCMSSLVHTLAQGYGASMDLGQPIKELSELAEQAYELAIPIPDYEEAATQEGWRHVGTELDRCMVFSRGTSITGADTVRACTWGELCELQNIDPYEWEVFEHWAVSPWLAEKLAAEGEKVDTDFAGMCVWARTCAGQGIASDGVIQRIHAAMVA